ncbi:MAG: ATP-binding cassette domain-containing protein [Syntrophorhabdaceae bacterium]|nr:ATP-binding cassette domain-containing protein [Syntrophorhabdaceae bacterium]
MNKTAPLRLVNAVLEPVLQMANHNFEKGSVTEIITGSAWNCVLLLEALLGMRALDRGNIVLLGENPGSLAGLKLHRLRSRIGVYLHGGGLILNLKAVENVALPLLYHSAESTDVIWEKALRALNQTGYDGDPFLPPGRLSEAQCAAVGLARVIAVNPEVVIYDRLGEGLPEAERKELFSMALDFHREKPDRATVFLSPHQSAIFGNTPAAVLNLSEGKLS